MNNNLKVLFITFAALIFLQGCYRDEILIPSEPSNRPDKLGVYVLSEGRGLANQSAFSFYSFANNDFSYNITFPSSLGLYPHGLINYGGWFFIIEPGEANGPGKIYKLDTNGVISVTNSAGINPYSLAALNNKIYCTNETDSSVSVIDLNTLNEIKKIKVGANPHEIISLNNNIYVANTGNTKTGSDSTVSVINSSTDLQIAKIKVNIAPSSLAVSKDGYLLAGTSGNGGMIYKINPSSPYQKIDSFSVNSLVIKDINVDYNSDNLYFISDYSVIIQLNLSTKVSTIIIKSTVANPLTYINGYAFDVKNRKHYIADAKDFYNYGYLYKYNTAGQIEQGFQTGIAPGRILVRN